MPLGEELNKKVSMFMDGVVLSMPPTDRVDRLNSCKSGETHMYRKRSEAAKPDLSGDDPMSHQVPLSRAVPLWGGISAHGFSPFFFHGEKKVSGPDCCPECEAERA